MVLRSLLKNRTILFSIWLVISGWAFFYCHSANAATLGISSDSANLSIGNTATLYVMVNSGGVAINNGEAAIKFPMDLVEVISVSKGGSIFTLWVEEPTFSNTTGLITFNGGVPTPGFNGSQGMLLSFVVKAKKVGQADFSFSSAAVRANDGLGTDVLSGRSGKTIVIISAQSPSTPKKEQTAEKSKLEETAPAGTGLTLKIYSPTHPNQSQWYQDDSPRFRWAVPTGADTIQTSIGSSVSAIPRVNYSPPISEKTVKDWADGVWYFRARARKDGAWGPISTYTVRIDNSAPVKKSVVYNFDETTRVLNIAADIEDKFSGIDYYEVYINDVLAKKIPVEEFIQGSYSLPLDVSQDNIVRLKAVDRAGNSVEDLGRFNAGVAPEAKVIPPAPTSVIGLNALPPMITAQEQLLIQGQTPEAAMEVMVNVKYNEELVTSLVTIANADGTFFVLTPKLKAGVYEIWAEAGTGDNQVASKHFLVKAVNLAWSMTITAYHLIILVIIIAVLILMGLGYYFFHHYRRNQHRKKLNAALSEEEQTKTLMLLKKRLEKHLAILQKIRHSRILTKEEKEIKQALESDLDEIDRELENLKTR